MSCHADDEPPAFPAENPFQQRFVDRPQAALGAEIRSPSARFRPVSGVAPRWQSHSGHSPAEK